MGERVEFAARKGGLGLSEVVYASAGAPGHGVAGHGVAGHGVAGSGERASPAPTLSACKPPAFDQPVPTPACETGRPRRAPAEHGDLPFLIKRDGTWLYRGSPIERKELVCLFSSVLRRDQAGDYWLETPAERGRIQVEDSPWVAVELEWTRCASGNHQCLTFRTNVDQVITAGPDHPIRVAHNALTCEPIPYLLVRPGNGGPPLEARISRPVYYELVALAVPGCCAGSKKLGVWSCGVFFPLGDLPPCAS
jgi:hypothetical protein